MSNAPITKVIFRVYTRKEFCGDVVALFPTLAGTYDPSTCTLYEHVGQHGSADYNAMLSMTRPANVSEYAPLKMELESIGYALHVMSRATHADYMERRKQTR